MWSWLLSHRLCHCQCRADLAGEVRCWDASLEDCTRGWHESEAAGTDLTVGNAVCCGEVQDCAHFCSPSCALLLLPGGPHGSTHIRYDNDIQPHMRDTISWSVFTYFRRRHPYYTNVMFSVQVLFLAVSMDHTQTWQVWDPHIPITYFLYIYRYSLEFDFFSHTFTDYFDFT